jgi:hypothetical protein
MQITLNVPDALIQRYLATLPEGADPKAELLRLVKQRIFDYESNARISEVREQAIQDLRNDLGL